MNICGLRIQLCLYAASLGGVYVILDLKISQLGFFANRATRCTASEEIWCGKD